MQRHSHIFAKLAQQKVAQPAVQLEPGILVDQADRLHRHLDRDEQGEAETVVGVGRPAAVLHAHDAVELVLWHLRPEYLGHELLEGGVDGSEWVDVRNRQVGLCLLGDEHVDVAACLLADEDDGAEEEVETRFRILLLSHIWSITLFPPFSLSREILGDFLHVSRFLMVEESWRFNFFLT